MPGITHAMLATVRANLAGLEAEAEPWRAALARNGTEQAHTRQRIAELELRLRFKLAPGGLVQNVAKTG